MRRENSNGILGSYLTDPEHLKKLSAGISKLNEETLHEYVASLLMQVGGGRGESYGTISPESVHAVRALTILHHLICLETNLDSACIIHAARKKILNEPQLGGVFSTFIRFPTCSGSRMMAFKVLRALDIAPERLSDDESVAAQYLAWREAKLQLGHPFDSVDTTTSAPIVLGPQSPLARSILGLNCAASNRNSHGTVMAALESREWVAFAASSRISVTPSLILGDMSWTSVNVPSITASLILGHLALKYRVNNMGGTPGYELKIDWKLPQTVDMYKVMNILWSQGGYIGFMDKGDAEWVPVLNEQANLTESKECVFKDNRRVGGTAVAHLVRSCMRSFNKRVVMAVTADPTSSSSITNPNVRKIRHLHFVGCEVDPDRQTLTWCALLSSESIFLIANDLLGERESLWKSLETLSGLIMSPGSTSKAFTDWLTLW